MLQRGKARWVLKLLGHHISALRVLAAGKYASTKIEGYLYSASLLQGFKVRLAW